MLISQKLSNLAVLIVGRSKWKVCWGRSEIVKRGRIISVFISLPTAEIRSSSSIAENLNEMQYPFWDFFVAAKLYREILFNIM